MGHSLISRDAGQAALYRGHDFEGVQRPQDRIVEFCPIALELAQREADARRKLVPGDNSRRAVWFANEILTLVRRRHRHVGHCPACLAAEVLTR
jgi:hypothetical protein